MKSKLIAQINPYLLDGHLVISLDQEWIKVFGKIPTFSVMINNEGKLSLCTNEQIIKRSKQ